ncbi:hypothetical protein AALP_AA3G098400 [Arabis alpina]|uniref:Uncharacterized protein n=1 Tax=Arabis alpina TaxID=50452 RepID=A0A087H866_ARAAL|nr:hypothetical protein AALP_AA3G098400 [Arabis alpina]
MELKIKLFSQDARGVRARTVRPSPLTSLFWASFERFLVTFVLVYSAAPVCVSLFISPSTYGRKITSISLRLLHNRCGLC